MKQYFFYTLLLCASIKSFAAQDDSSWQTPSEQMRAILMPDELKDKKSPEQKALDDFNDTRCKRQTGGVLLTAAMCYFYCESTQKINEQLTPWTPGAPILPEVVDHDLETVQCASWLGIFAGLFITADQCCARPSTTEKERAWTIVQESKTKRV